MIARSRLNADLHAHSTESDGALAPSELVRRAAAFGVDLLALTDHDTVSGIASAAETAAAEKLRFVPGVEVSASYAGRTIHVVGLGIDPLQQTLLDGLSSVRRERHTRARAIAEGLAAAGVEGALEGALRHARNPDLISRTHFARYLVEAGIAANLHDVFRRFLVEGKPGYVEQRWASLAQSVDWIRAAGGVAVLAHPGRYRGDDGFHWSLCGDFQTAGGAAIEIASSSHGADDVQRFSAIARALGLEASCGSDFHAPGETGAELGKIAPLPSDLIPVWHRFL
jgi:predicted metal-dependent phosphoesterase TrpH